jgi:hypothetical protein
MKYPIRYFAGRDDTSKGDGFGRKHVFLFSMPKYRRFTTPGARPSWSLEKKKFLGPNFILNSVLYRCGYLIFIGKKKGGWEYSQNDTNHIRLGHRKAEDKTK